MNFLLQVVAILFLISKLYLVKICLNDIFKNKYYKKYIDSIESQYPNRLRCYSCGTSDNTFNSYCADPFYSPGAYLSYCPMQYGYFYCKVFINFI